MEKKLHYCPNCLEKGKIMDYFIDNNSSTKCAICQSQLKELDISFDEWDRMKKILKNPDFMFTVKKLIELNMIEINNTTSNSNTNNASIYSDEENILNSYGLIDSIDDLKTKTDISHISGNYTKNKSEPATPKSETQSHQNIVPSDYKPKCPTCGSTDIKKIGGLERAGSVYMFGIFSKKINKSFECNNCKFTW